MVELLGSSGIEQGALSDIAESQAGLTSHSQTPTEIQTACPSDDQIEIHPSKQPETTSTTRRLPGYAAQADAVGPIASVSTLVIGDRIGVGQPLAHQSMVAMTSQKGPDSLVRTAPVWKSDRRPRDQGGGLPALRNQLHPRRRGTVFGFPGHAVSQR